MHGNHAGSESERAVRIAYSFCSSIVFFLLCECLVPRQGEIADSSGGGIGSTIRALSSCLPFLFLSLYSLSGSL